MRLQLADTHGCTHSSAQCVLMHAHVYMACSLCIPSRHHPTSWYICPYYFLFTHSDTYANRQTKHPCTVRSQLFGRCESAAVCWGKTHGVRVHLNQWLGLHIGQRLALGVHS